MEPVTIQKYEIREDQIIQPLLTILDEVTPKTSQKQHHQSNSTSITGSLNELFPEQVFESKDIQKTKEILGAQAKDFTPGELRDITSEVKFLVESWLDDFERQTFNGLTLKELLHEKGRV